MATDQTYRADAQGSAGGPVLPFVVGTVLGATVGAVAGVLVTRYGVQLAATIIGFVDRRTPRDDEGRPRFELLLQ